MLFRSRLATICFCREVRRVSSNGLGRSPTLLNEETNGNASRHRKQPLELREQDGRQTEATQTNTNTAYAYALFPKGTRRQANQIQTRRPRKGRQTVKEAARRPHRKTSTRKRPKNEHTTPRTPARRATGVHKRPHAGGHKQRPRQRRITTQRRTELGGHKEGRRTIAHKNTTIQTQTEHKTRLAAAARSQSEASICSGSAGRSKGKDTMPRAE